MSRRPLALGERGDVFYTDRGGRVTAFVNYRDHAGKRRRAKAAGTSKAAARRAVTAAVDAALQGDAPPSSSCTVERAGQEWLQDVAALVARGVRSPTTLDAYRRTLNAYVVPGLGGLRITELTPGRIDRFLSAMLTQHGYSSAKMCRTVLSGLCGRLVRADVLRSNPVRDVGRLERSRPRAPKPTLTREGITAWLAVLDADPVACRRDLPDLVRFMLATGVRIGEALALTWDDVDLDAGSVVVQWTIVRVAGVGLVRNVTKAVTSDRTLRLPTWCVELLRARRAGAADSAPVFPSRTGSWRDRDNVSADLREARGGTEFEWFVSHTARRTVATLLDGDGLSARTIADQLGHAQVSMTQNVYMGRRLSGDAAARSLDGLVPSTAGE